jgi:hypothetical protein
MGVILVDVPARRRGAPFACQFAHADLREPPADQVEAAEERLRASTGGGWVRKSMCSEVEPHHGRVLRRAAQFDVAPPLPGEAGAVGKKSTP